MASSTFDGASIFITPSGYKASVLYPTKPLGTNNFTVTRGTTATRVNASGLIESVASGVPRLDYTGGGCPALLVEPAATNLLLYSEQFDNAAWAKSSGGTGLAPVVTPNAAIAPNGTMTADLIVFDRGAGNSSADRSRIDQLGSVTVGTMYNAGLFIKAASPTEVGKEIALRVATNDAYSVFTLTNEWQRINRSNEALVAGIFMGLDIRGGITANNQVSCHVWGAQIETGSVATSYIPTVAATQTRNADVISLSSVSGLIGQTQGTIYVDVNISNPDKSTIRTILGIGDGTTANRFSIRRDTNGRIIVICVVGSSTLGFVQTTATDQVGVFKIAVAYAANDLTMYINGSSIGSTTIASVPACSRVDIGKVEGTGTTNQLNDRISAAAIYTSRLSNAELQSLTTL